MKKTLLLIAVSALLSAPGAFAREATPKAGLSRADFIAMKYAEKTPIDSYGNTVTFSSGNHVRQVGELLYVDIRGSLAQNLFGSTECWLTVVVNPATGSVVEALMKYHVFSCSYNSGN